MDDRKLIPDRQTEVGLDHYQVRRYNAWHRHITLAMLAHTYSPSQRQSPQSPGSGLIPVTPGEVKRLLAHLITTLPQRVVAWTWSHCARRHQRRAKQADYQRRCTKDPQVRLEYQGIGLTIASVQPQVPQPAH